MLGLHWVVDAFGCDPLRLTPDGVREALIEIPARLGLTAIDAPRLSAEPVDGIQSVAGVVLLAESHASCHCFPIDGAAHLDVFSCRHVDFDAARRFVLRHFGAAELRESVLRRGGAESRHHPPAVSIRRK